MGKNGEICSHTNGSGQNALKFKKGDLVQVELDPSTGRLTYRNAGTSSTQETYVRSSNT